MGLVRLMRLEPLLATRGRQEILERPGMSDLKFRLAAIRASLGDPALVADPRTMPAAPKSYPGHPADHDMKPELSPERADGARFGTDIDHCQWLPSDPASAQID